MQLIRISTVILAEDPFIAHHCLEVIACFVHYGGIVDHHCLEVIVCFVDIGRFWDYH